MIPGSTLERRSDGRTNGDGPTRGRGRSDGPSRGRDALAARPSDQLLFAPCSIVVGTRAHQFKGKNKREDEPEPILRATLLSWLGREGGTPSNLGKYAFKGQKGLKIARQGGQRSIGIYLDCPSCSSFFPFRKSDIEISRPLFLSLSLSVMDSRANSRSPRPSVSSPPVTPSVSRIEEREQGESSVEA